jgi:hypothetical protein
MKVEAATMELTIGPARRKVRAAARGTPLPSSRLTTGTMAHSQTGSSNPMAPASKTDRIRCRRTTRSTQAAGTKISISPPARDPTSMKGRASTMIARKLIAILPIRPCQAGVWPNNSSSMATARKRRLPTQANSFPKPVEAVCFDG